MELKDYLEEKVSLINKTLDALLPKEDDYPQNLHKAMRYSVFAGGKRLRPIFVLAANEAAGGDIKDAINTACAFECIHTYSLIHDDLPAIDNDDLRRGKPTLHKVFGEAVAILTGDALLTLAFELAALTHIDDKGKLLRVVMELSKSSGHAGMVGGQVVDMESEGKEVSFPLLEHIHIHKTGQLIVAALRCGAVLGGADEFTLERITHYGDCIGLAYQIADDVLNVEGSREGIGKPAGSDIQRKKATYPSLLGVKESKKLAEELIGRALASIEGLDERALPLREIAKFIVERKH